MCFFNKEVGIIFLLNTLVGIKVITLFLIGFLKVITNGVLN